MIRHLKYHQIDFEKYTRCLENSAQYKYCAQKNYLDVTSSKQWSLLVYGDYDAVMPLPYIRKAGIKIVINPRLCQQLGVFSKEDSKATNQMFLNFLKKNYAVWYYAFNDSNEFEEQLHQKKNFLISPKNYEEVYKSYSPKRKRKLRLDDDVLINSEIKYLSFEEAEPFINQHMQSGADGDTAAYLRIFKEFYASGNMIFPAFFFKGNIINLLALYYDNYTVALLGTVNDPEHLKLSGASVLIDKMLSKNIADKIFDFEGGDLPNIEEFFRGFRPELRPYPMVKYSKKNVIKQMVILLTCKGNVFLTKRLIKKRIANFAHL